VERQQFGTNIDLFLSSTSCYRQGNKNRNNISGMVGIHFISELHCVCTAEKARTSQMTEEGRSTRKKQSFRLTEGLFAELPNKARNPRKQLTTEELEQRRIKVTNQINYILKLRFLTLSLTFF